MRDGVLHSDHSFALSSPIEEKVAEYILGTSLLSLACERFCPPGGIFGSILHHMMDETSTGLSFGLPLIIK